MGSAWKNLGPQRVTEHCPNLKSGGFLEEVKGEIRYFCLALPPPIFSSVQSLSRVGLFATPWTAARQASLSITNSQSLLKLMSIELVMPSSHLILCHPLLLPPIPPSIRVFSNESPPPNLLLSNPPPPDLRCPRNCSGRIHWDDGGQKLWEGEREPCPSPNTRDCISK